MKRLSIGVGVVFVTLVLGISFDISTNPNLTWAATETQPNNDEIVLAGSGAVLLGDGQIWSLDPWNGWSMVTPPIPIPVDEVSYLLNSESFIDDSGCGWCRIDSVWITHGPPASEDDTEVGWGSLKAMYR